MTLLARILAHGLARQRQMGNLCFLHDREPAFCVGVCADRDDCKESISTTLTELELPKDRELQPKEKWVRDSEPT